MRRFLTCLTVLALSLPTAGTHGATCRAEESGQSARRVDGIAAAYPGDQGIARDPAVIFADDFERWSQDGTRPLQDTWSVRKNGVSTTRAVPPGSSAHSKITLGDRILEIACWTPGSGSQVGGLSLRLGNYNHANEELGDGYDELYIRYYIRFDEAYRGVRNHGANLGGRDLTRSDAAWVGMAGIRDVSTRGYFYSGVQPYGAQGSSELEIGFYSYHLDKKGPWGENYDVTRKTPVYPGRWYCIERHMKLNSVDLSKPDPAKADGIEELWVDGQLTIRNDRVRFRRTLNLHATLFSLETYYHGLPERYDKSNPIRVCFDNVVIARKYIGPVHGQTGDTEP